MPQSSQYVESNVTRAAMSELWAIHAPKLEQIAEFLEMRAAGVAVSEEDVQAAISGGATPMAYEILGREPSEDDGPLIVDGVQFMSLIGSLGPRMNLMTAFSGGTSTQQFSKELDEAAANSKVRSILVEVDSPGGVVSGTEEARLAVRRAAEKKRVVMIARNMMASAAYYIGAAGTAVYAEPSTEVGSIGVYTIMRNIVAAAEQAGVKFHVFRAGDLKASGNAYEELTAERRASVQKRIDDAYKMFIAAVANDRGVSTAEVIQNFGQGSVMLADEAAGLGMIDDVRLIRDVVQEERDRNSKRTAVPPGLAAGAVQTVSIEERDPMNAKIKAALFARGLISDVNADDSVCMSVLTAWFSGRGQDVPSKAEDVLAALNGDGNVLATVETVEQPAANVQQAHDDEMAEARRASEEQGKIVERERIDDINAAAEAFGAEAEDVKSAIADGTSHAEFVKELQKKKAAAEPSVDTVNVTGDGEQRWASDAVDALAYRVQRANNRHDPNASADVRRLAGAPLLQFAMQSLEFSGQRVDRFANGEDIAEMAMDVPGADRKVKFFSEDDGGPVLAAAGGGAYNRPGAFPNLLSNLANKILDDAIDLAGKHYNDWTAVYPGGLPDFKPAPVINKGQADEMDEVMDAEAFKEVTLSEEVLSYLYLRRFGNKIGLTPVLIANDDMNALTEDAYALGEAWETTVNRLCLGMLTGNVSLLDTYSLFDDTNHGNDVTSGAAPSDATWAALEVKMAAQTGIGTDQRIEAILNTILVPTGAQHQAARRTFQTYEELRETKEAATTANIGLYRGQVAVVPEPGLNASSTAKWYGFADPTQFRRATVIRAYFRGYGQRGRRERWYDPETKTTWVSLEGRIGAAVKSYRFAQRNAGA